MTAKHPMIPFPVIVRAADGDIEAINQIVRHYSGFIASRSMRPMKDEYGNTHMVVDETLRRRMETRLIAKILSFGNQGTQTRNNARLWKRGQTHASPDRGLPVY